MGRAVLALLILAGAATPARADVFAFTDLEGFEKCMQLDHLVETVATPKGAQTRMLGPREIQPRCLETAARLIAQGKKQDEALAFIASGKRLGAWENTVELVGALADFAPAGCDALAAYEVITRALEQPKSSGYFVRTRAVVKRCLKDPAFRRDLIEEKDSADATLRANVCEILIDEKLVKSCKAVKP